MRALSRAAAVLSLGASPCVAEGVLSTYIASVGPAPSVTVVQEENAFGQSFYARVLEDEVSFQVEIYGGCNANWRVQSAKVDQCANVVEVCPGGLNSLPRFVQVFDVNQDAKSFGPRTETVSVPTSFLETYLTGAGNDLIDLLASLTEGSNADWRRIELRDTVKWSLSFVFYCRRWFGNNDLYGQSSTTLIPFDVTFRATQTGDAELPFGIQPILPGAPEPAVPFEALSARPLLHTVRLGAVADATGDPCRVHLHADFGASEATAIVYHVESADGSRSPDYRLSAGTERAAQSRLALAFPKGAVRPEGFLEPPKTASEPRRSAMPLATDPLHGFLRIVTTAPHSARSNLVAYDLDSCRAHALHEAPTAGARAAASAESLAAAFGPKRPPAAAEPAQ